MKPYVKKGIIETILSHPFGVALIAHSTIMVVQYIRTGKVEPFINLSVTNNKIMPEEDTI